MERKRMIWKTKGMNRDLSVSAFNPEFAFENWNLRLSTAEGNTLMSWVSEKGTELVEFGTGGNAPGTVLHGSPVGTAMINHQLVVFTTGGSWSTTDNDSPVNHGPDHIYVIKNNGVNLTLDVIYSGNLNLDVAHPLETLVSYESDSIQKVYWVDGRNQPRLINIMDFYVGTEAHETNVTSEEVDTRFDFVPTINAFGSISVTKNLSGGGTFAPGTIQYCCTYVNKHGQQTNIAWCSPLYYLTYSDRGASPEDKVSCSFTIQFSSVSGGFDYLRLYSIHRTSLDGQVEVRQLVDLDIVYSENAYHLNSYYTDNGTTGTIIDPTELLFIGGKEIIAGTMVDKDGTLFLGNIQEMNNGGSISAPIFTLSEKTKSIPLKAASGIYSYDSQIAKYNQQQVAYFKAGQHYRLGIQLQRKTGEWSEPIHLTDHVHHVYPSYNNGVITIPVVQASLALNVSAFADYVNVRPVVVYPTISDREVICQGVLNPTVFNALDRIDNSPYAQASWFFRPFVTNTSSSNPTVIVPKFPPSSGGGSISVAYLKNVPSTIVTPSDNTALGSANFESVYVMTADYYADDLETVKTKGSIETKSWSETDDWYNPTVLEHPVKGIIDLTPNGNEPHKYAFISSKRWPNEYDYKIDYNSTYGTTSSYTVKYTGAVTGSVSTSERAFSLYKKILSDCRMLYYVAPDNADAHNTYTFIFRDNTYQWTVVFAKSGIEEDVIDVGSIGKKGDDLVYAHYNSLTGLSYPSGLIRRKSLEDTHLRSSEIQGAKSIVNGFNDLASEITRTSNMQFFVDQSIVTLNSPDIEFDTEVQTLDMSNTQLYVVGAVPISAYTSAHHITIDSNMHEAESSSATDIQRFGSGEVSNNVTYYVGDTDAGRRLISDYLWNDVALTIKDNDVTPSTTGKYFMVYPWQRTGSLNNDNRSADKASSLLKTKKMSHLLFSEKSIFRTRTIQQEGEDVEIYSPIEFDDISTQIHLMENDYVINYRLPSQSLTAKLPDINYYPNIDKVLYNSDGYHSIYYDMADVSKNVVISKDCLTSPVSMKYKSTSHAVIALNKSTDNILPILPTPSSVSVSGQPYFWRTDNNATLGYSSTAYNLGTGINRYLLLGELRRNPSNQFGGISPEALRANKWEVCGDTVPINRIISESNDGTTLVEWTGGDTYYQRYDCLKTYAFTPEDTNQIVEILSFMCETHVNIDGRYDRNRGQVDNTNMSPQNFNLLNPVYSQHDNFFPIRKAADDGNTNHHYPNWITYSKTKTSGADVDLWTNVTLASTLELDGDKGEITSLQRLNDQIIAFQDKGISQILYNENVQIQSTAGVPIEIANSGKVQGKRYLSNTIGCHNKWSIVQTPSGLYFMDSNDKSIYLFNGQLQNISLQHGFDSWCKQWITQGVWNTNFSDGAFVGYYDRQNQDVLYVNQTRALAFSEKIGEFTSFYSYGGAQYLCELDDEEFWVRRNTSSNPTVFTSSLWKHRGSDDYCNFFGKNSYYGTTLIANPEPLRDKIFTNIEFRAYVEGNAGLPFDNLYVENDYQHGDTILSEKNGHDLFKHHTNDGISTLKRKFRIWRCDIPRDSVHRNDRMRNPWLKITLEKGNIGSEIPSSSGTETAVTWGGTESGFRTNRPYGYYYISVSKSNGRWNLEDWISLYTDRYNIPTKVYTAANTNFFVNYSFVLGTPIMEINYTKNSAGMTGEYVFSNSALSNIMHALEFRGHSIVVFETLTYMVDSTSTSVVLELKETNSPAFVEPPLHTEIHDICMDYFV